MRGVYVPKGRDGRGVLQMVKIDIKYNPKLKQIARNLRKNSTLSEVLLWNELKGKKLMGIDFHRQKPIGNYIADFFSPEMRLVIEIDGITHAYKQKSDRERQDYLESIPLTVLRFQDSDVKKNMNAVLETIKEWMKENMETS